MATWSERYDAGDRHQVWEELHALGPLGALPRAVREEAEIVAVSTMKRAVSNIRSLHDRLVTIGFEFDSPDVSFAPERVASAHDRAELEARVGKLPPLVDALVSTVGYVSFRGWLPAFGSREEWRDQYLDPLEILLDIPDAIETYEHARDVDSVEAPVFELTIAGDYLHKNDVSGGAATFIRLPSDEADGRVIEDDGATPAPTQGMWLVDYLRMYFESGGFRHVAGTRSYPADVVRYLADGLLQM